jgi:hypothetical protein
MESLLHTVREEVPGTAAVVRLSGLEIADAVEEVSSLGSDLTQGIRASARALANAEAGMRQGGDLAGRALADAIKTKAPAARGEGGACAQRIALRTPASSSPLICPRLPCSAPIALQTRCSTR